MSLNFQSKINLTTIISKYTNCEKSESIRWNITFNSAASALWSFSIFIRVKNWFPKRNALTKLKRIFNVISAKHLILCQKTNGAVTIFLRKPSNDTGVTLCMGRQYVPLKSFQRGVYHCLLTVSNLYLGSRPQQKPFLISYRC